MGLQGAKENVANFAELPTREGVAGATTAFVIHPLATRQQGAFPCPHQAQRWRHSLVRVCSRIFHGSTRGQGQKIMFAQARFNPNAYPLDHRLSGQRDALKGAMVELMQRVVPNPTHAITAKFHNTTSGGTRISPDRCARALDWLKMRLDREVFGHKATRQKLGVKMIGVMEGLRPFQQIHAHIAVQTPDGWSNEGLSQSMQNLVTKHSVFWPPLFIEPYRSNTWLNYLSKDGPEGLILFKI